MKKCPQVGGQAVLEGVMMRSPGCLAVAVRRANGEIVVREDIWRSLWEKFKFLRWPFFRGTVVLVEAMVNGMQALNFSAQQAMEDEEPDKSKESGGSQAGMFLGLVLGLVVAIGLFKALPHLAAAYAGFLLTGAQWTIDDMAYHVVDGVVKLGIFIGYVASIGLIRDIQRVFQYHGAEHMAIHTLEAGEELIVENARKKSRLHPRCGTAFLMVVIIVFVVVAAVAMPFLPEAVTPGPGKPWYNHVWVVLLKLPLLIPVAGLAYEFNRFAGKHANSRWLKPLMSPGMAMQLLTTKQPTDEQLEIGLVALKAALWRESVGRSLESAGKPVVFENFEKFLSTLADGGTLNPKADAGVS